MHAFPFLLRSHPQHVNLSTICFQKGLLRVHPCHPKNELSCYWYFPAYDLNNERINLYRADRIIELREGSISKTELPHLKQWLKESNSTPIENPREIVLRINRKAVRGNSNLFFEFSKIVWEDENTGILHQCVSECEFPYIVSLVLSFGPEAEIIEPSELRDLFISRLQDTFAIYRKM